MKKAIIVVPKGKATLSTITGPFEILRGANGFWKRKGHKQKLDICLAGLEPEVKLDAGFFSVHPENLLEIKKADLIIIPAIVYDEHLIKENEELLNWIKDQYKNGAEVATMCSGAFLLAATGLLNGKSCSTHWNHAQNFRRLYPHVNVQEDKLIIAEKGIYTNGGAYSFLHLILFLIEKYFDRETAIYCSKIFQIDMDRSSQSPFFIFQAQKNHGDELIGKAQAYLEQHLTEKISFEKMASKLAISRRNFDRRFIQATGNTPVEYFQRIKVEVAKNTLEKGRKSVFEVMSDVGYSDDKAFREIFRRLTGLSPLEYRNRFSGEVN